MQKPYMPSWLVWVVLLLLLVLIWKFLKEKTITLKSEIQFWTEKERKRKKLFSLLLLITKIMIFAISLVLILSYSKWTKMDFITSAVTLFGLLALLPNISNYFFPQISFSQDTLNTKLQIGIEKVAYGKYFGASKVIREKTEELSAAEETLSSFDSLLSSEDIWGLSAK